MLSGYFNVLVDLKSNTLFQKNKKSIYNGLQNEQIGKFSA